MKKVFSFTRLKFESGVLMATIYVDFIIFFYSGVDKLSHFDQFVNNFSKSPFARNQYLSELSLTIIFLEIGLSLLLFFDKAKRIALIGFGILSFLFSLYISLMLFYSPYLPCSCGGIIDILSWNEHLVLTVFLFFLSFYSAELIKNENS